MSAPQAFIVADHVCKSFGSHQVLRDVSTHFSTGEVTVIIGASGSGKSTLLRAINRLEPHDSGTITIDGVVVSDDTATLQKQRCEVGMVFQQFNLFGHLSVLDNITLAPRRVRHTARAEANAQAMVLLRRVGLQSTLSIRGSSQGPTARGHCTCSGASPRSCCSMSHFSSGRKWFRKCWT
jgi:polar amino acid transport system ATP-binding protein